MIESALIVWAPVKLEIEARFPSSSPVLALKNPPLEPPARLMVEAPWMVWLAVPSAKMRANARLPAEPPVNDSVPPPWKSISCSDAETVLLPAWMRARLP